VAGCIEPVREREHRQRQRHVVEAEGRHRMNDSVLENRLDGGFPASSMAVTRMRSPKPAFGLMPL